MIGFFLFSVEAVHLANLLCQFGYYFPINELKNLLVKDDSSLYRFQVKTSIQQDQFGTGSTLVVHHWGTEGNTTFWNIILCFIDFLCAQMKYMLWLNPKERLWNDVKKEFCLWIQTGLRHEHSNALNSFTINPIHNSNEHYTSVVALC